MFALYFQELQGGKVFLLTVGDRHQASTMARLLSSQDPRDVLIVENTDTGETRLHSIFRKGAKIEHYTAPPSGVTPQTRPGGDDAR